MGDDVVMDPWNGECPDPSPAASVAEFVEALGWLRAWAGYPSYRTLAKRVGPLLRPPQVVSHTTVADVFQPHRRRLDMDLVVAIVRALGVGDPAVANWREACVKAHAGAKTDGTALVSRQLPADLATFTGREAELARLLRAFSAAGSAGQPTVVVSAIEGMGGIGKTQLAVHAAHELVRSGRCLDLQLYVNLRGFDAEQAPADPAAVLDAFLRQLGVPGPQIPDGLDARALMFRDRMHGRDALILLDNAAAEWQVRDLIPASPTCLVLITSRRTLAALDGATVHLLDVFSSAEAVDLMARIAGDERVRDEPRAAEAIALACGLLPLAVAVAAARLRSRPAWSLADMEQRLLTGPLSAISAGSRTLTPVFDLSYRGLASAARRVFRLLALHPGEDFTVDAIAALIGAGAAETETALELLQDDSLLQQKTAGRYSLHDLLRAYATEMVGTVPPAERSEALHRLLSWYTQSADAASQAIMPSRYSLPLRLSGTHRPETRFDDSGKAMAWYDAENTNLVAAVEAAAQHGPAYLAWRLPAAMATYVGLRCDWRQWDRLHHLGLAAAEESQDLAGEAWIRSNLGISGAEQGRFDEAVEQLTRALEIRRVLGDESGQAAASGNLARVYNYAGQLEKALHCAQQSLDLSRRCGDRRRESAALNSVACCLGDLERPEEALGYLREKRKLHDEDGDPRGLGLALHNIGEMEIALGHHADAAESYREALDVARGFGDRHGEAGAQHGIALALLGQGSPDEARDLLRQALAVFEELGTPEVAAVREQLAALGSGASAEAIT